MRLASRDSQAQGVPAAGPKKVGDNNERASNPFMPVS